MDKDLLKKALELKYNIEHLDYIISGLTVKIYYNGESAWLYRHIGFDSDEINKKIVNNIKQQLRRKRDKLKNELNEL